MSAEAESVRNLLSQIDTIGLEMPTDLQAEFRQIDDVINRRYNRIFESMTDYLGSIAQLNTAHFYQIAPAFSEARSTKRILVAPPFNKMLHNNDEAPSTRSLVRVMMSAESWPDDPERTLECSDYVVDLISRRIISNYQTVAIGTDQDGGLVWPCESDDTPKVLRDWKHESDPEVGADVVVHLGMAYESTLFSPVNKDHEKLNDIQKLQQIVQWCGPSFELAIDSFKQARH